MLVFRRLAAGTHNADPEHPGEILTREPTRGGCLLYTSDAADERSSVDLGGRRIIKQTKTLTTESEHVTSDK